MSKRRGQLELSLPRLARDGTRRGMVGAKVGRKPNGERAMEPHLPRAAITSRTPVHVTLRLAADLGNLRRRRAYHAIRRATIVASRRRDATIVHISIQANHVHLLVEARDAHRLGEGLRRFAISAARQLNAAVSGEREQRRAGRVFVDRYHAEIITSPRQARSTLAYVLNNWRRHHADHAAPASSWPFDPFSSASSFRGWRERTPSAWPPASYEPLVVGDAASWLLSAGWQRYGRIALRERPGPNA